MVLTADQATQLQQVIEKIDARLLLLLTGGDLNAEKQAEVARLEALHCASLRLLAQTVAA